MKFNLAYEAYIPSCPMVCHLAIRLNNAADTQSLDNSLCSVNGTELRAAANGFRLLTTEAFRIHFWPCSHASEKRRKLCKPYKSTCNSAAPPPLPSSLPSETVQHVWSLFIKCHRMTEPLRFGTRAIAGNISLSFQMMSN